jgi:hypothetical protein
VADVKSCIECKRPMAVTFDACPFCQAVQPAQKSDVPRELKCAKCSRVYSSKLEACPFCAIQEVLPQANVARPLPARKEDLRANEEASELGVWVKVGALGVFLLLTALWSFVSSIGGDRLGDGDTGLFGPCLFIGVVLAAGTGFLFHRWTDARALPITGIVAAAFIIPWAGTAYGMAKWFNAYDIDDRVQPVECVLTSKQKQHGKHGGSWWLYRYRCNVEGGVELHGEHPDFEALPISAETGDTIRLDAVRGRLGVWLRRSKATSVLSR